MSSAQRAFAGHLDDLNAIFREIWVQLQRATVDATHGWHLPVLGTIDGFSPCLRTVVLRGANSQEMTLRCHTDIRSEKVAHIRRSPEVSWLFYDSNMRTQLRIQSLADIHKDDEIADEMWEQSRLESRRCYLAPLPPRATTHNPGVNLPANLQKRPPTLAESSKGRHNFAVIDTRITCIEWLWLHHNGNRSARYRVRGKGEVNSSWITA